MTLDTLVYAALALLFVVAAVADHAERRAAVWDPTEIGTISQIDP